MPRPSLLALFATPLLVVACGAAAPSEDVGTSSAAITPIYGVDYSWYRPAPSSLVADGYQFVCRYSSNDTTGKNLSASEAQSLEAAGLDIVLNWEDGAENSLSGYNQGVTDATTANQEGAADGQPSTRPIYFSVDFDADSSQLATIQAYFQGVASVIGLSRTGVYGGYYIVNALFNAGTVTWAWQTYAWSSGQWDSRAQLRQIQNGLAGGEMDEDEAMVADYGQWGPGTAPPAPTCTNSCTYEPRVGVAAAPTGEGYWIVDAAGDVYPNGDAAFFGDLAGSTLAKPIVGIAAAPSGQGYWLVAADGGVFAFGSAGFYGSEGGKSLNKPMVGMAATPDGAGYWLVAADGGIFTFGSAGFYGSTGSITLNKSVVGMAATHTGQGYWLAAADGGVFAFGDATFEGSAASMMLNAPVVGIAATSTGNGYWLVAADGGIFSYGNAAFEGSAGSLHLNAPVVGMAATTDDAGYWLAAADGGIFTYGDAPYLGNGLGSSCSAGVPQDCALQSNGCYALQAGSACATGQACANGTCQATCTDACTAGASQCSGADIQVCGRFGSVPCTAWSTATACPTGQSCTDNVCKSPTCADTCEPGATECVGGDLVTCSQEADAGCHTWGAPVACQPGQTCQPGGCMGGVVTDGGVQYFPDAGGGHDAGDAGLRDAGEHASHDAAIHPEKDGGGKGHSGQADAGETSVEGGEPPPAGSSSGCGCSFVGGPAQPRLPLWGALSVLGLAVTARRRRRAT
jgi:MYXO-CTERM domain-containing protein